MILMFGDVHGCFKHVLPVVQKMKPNAVIFLGDLDMERPFEQEVAEVVARKTRVRFRTQDEALGFCPGIETRDCRLDIRRRFHRFPIGGT